VKFKLLLLAISNIISDDNYTV